MISACLMVWYWCVHESGMRRPVAVAIATCAYACGGERDANI